MGRPGSGEIWLPSPVLGSRPHTVLYRQYCMGNGGDASVTWP